MDTECIVRHEFFGLLIYSKRQGGYLRPANQDTEEEIKDLLADRDKNGELNLSRITSSSLRSDLTELGFNTYTKEIFSWSHNRLSAPLECYFDYTNRCNFRCSFCYNADHLGYITMTEEQISRVFFNLYNNGIMRVHLAGGEPTIDIKHLSCYLENAKKYNMTVSFTTNGSLLGTEVHQLLINNHVSTVTVSLDGFTRKAFKERRGVDLFDKICANIEDLVQMRNTEKIKTKIAIKPTIPIGATKEDLENYIKLGLKLGVDKVKLNNPERSLFLKKGYYTDGIQQHYNHIDMISILKEEYRNSISVDNIHDPTKRIRLGVPGMTGCIGGQELIAINPDGRITPCLVYDKVLGNFNDWSDLSIFFKKSGLYTAYLLNLKLKEAKECSSCAIYESCRGGCQVRKLSEYRDLEKQQPLCPYHIKRVPNTDEICKPNFLKYGQHFEIVSITHS